MSEETVVPDVGTGVLEVVDSVGEELTKASDQVTFFYKKVVQTVREVTGENETDNKLVCDLVAACQSQYQLNLSADFSNRVANAARAQSLGVGRSVYG